MIKGCAIPCKISVFSELSSRLSALPMITYHPTTQPISYHLSRAFITIALYIGEKEVLYDCVTYIRASPAKDPTRTSCNGRFSQVGSYIL